MIWLIYLCDVACECFGLLHNRQSCVLKNNQGEELIDIFFRLVYWQKDRYIDDR